MIIFVSNDFKKRHTNPTSNNYRLVVLNEENYEERLALRLSKLNVPLLLLFFFSFNTASIIFLHL